MIQEARQKYYYPCMAKYIKKWVSNCHVCIQTKRINNDLLRTELLNCPEWDLGPEDILQMDILPNLPQAEAMIISSRRSTSSQNICLSTL